MIRSSSDNAYRFFYLVDTNLQPVPDVTGLVKGNLEGIAGIGRIGMIAPHIQIDPRSTSRHAYDA